ncbi:serine/threonine-protein phosphatase BSL1 [Lathyrus oleraceus]|uniref:serine/threonine-protein phosphatase BSL1 n=1 Tax=Pisum sativum TaxID=3888 RepID=UPI0021CEC804|nr:serine/threonine-protein phosphatase BSL1-like [Pisum sativum]
MVKNTARSVDTRSLEESMNKSIILSGMRITLFILWDILLEHRLFVFCNKCLLISITSLSGAFNGTTRTYFDGIQSEDGKTLKPICLLQLCRIGVILYDWLDIAWLKNYYNFGFDHFNMSWRKIGVWGLVDCLLGNAGFDKYSLEKLREASAAEAEAASAVWQSVQAISSSPVDETSVSDDNSHAADTVADGSDTKGDVHLHPRAVVVAKEAIGNLGGMVRQLSLDQFENESRRMLPINSDSPYPTKKFTRQKSPQGLHKKIISNLLRPRNWKAPANRRFFLDSYEVGELCYAAEQIFMHEPTVLQLKAPVKVFGDLHGQFGDLMRLFDEYGFPSTAGDITLNILTMFT